MRTIVDIPDRQISDLTAICQIENISRAEVIRQAIEAYILGRNPGAVEQAFGVWKARSIDGLAYQEEVRGEW